MIKYLYKQARLASMLASSNNKKANSTNANSPVLNKDLNKNLETFQNILGNSPDIIVREFNCGQDDNIHVALLFVDGLADKMTINQNIIKPLMYDIHLLNKQGDDSVNDINNIKTALLAIADVKKYNSVDEAIKGILYGDTLLLLDGTPEVLVIDSKGWQNRGVQEPSTEQVIRGPREGFTETIRFNTALLRRKILHSDFTIEQTVVGEKTRTFVALAYLKGVANPRVVEEVKRRLNQIHTDAILESGYIEQFIEDAPFSPFSTVGNSEKPDVVAARILEGRIAILVDGTPVVLTVPMLFVEGFQASEDYYSRPYLSSFLRLIRFLSFFISLLAPAAYVALTTFHQELIPTPLIITMAAATDGTPLPAVAESLLMGVVYEILREGGVRLPQQVGPALSIVGALIIGDAAVSAGLIGAPMVIVVAITAIASFLAVAHTDATTLLRFALVILAGTLGAFGIIIGLLAVLIHLCSLRSFGTPYLSPIAPLTPGDFKDVFIRAPLWMMLTRPRTIANFDPQRQEFRLKPEHPEEPRNKQ